MANDAQPFFITLMVKMPHKCLYHDIYGASPMFTPPTVVTLLSFLFLTFAFAISSLVMYYIILIRVISFILTNYFEILFWRHIQYFFKSPKEMIIASKTS